MSRRIASEEEWLDEVRVQLLIEAIARGVTSEERAEANLHRDAINRHLRPTRVAQPNYAALGFGSADDAEGRN